MELTPVYLMNNKDVEEDLKPCPKVRNYKPGRGQQGTSGGRIGDSLKDFWENGWKKITIITKMDERTNETWSTLNWYKIRLWYDILYENSWGFPLLCYGVIIKIVKITSYIKGFTLSWIMQTIFARARYILSLVCGPKLSYNNPNCTSGWLTQNNAHWAEALTGIRKLSIFPLFVTTLNPYNSG